MPGQHCFYTINYAVQIKDLKDEIIKSSSNCLVKSFLLPN